MKKRAKFFPFIILLIISAIMLAVCVFNLKGSEAYASVSKAERGPYDYHFVNYDVTYDVKSNREISVTEKMQINYEGYANTGFFKYIPLNGGEQVKNVKVTENGGYVPYGISTEYVDDVVYLNIDIGSNSRKSGLYSYELTYKYCLTRAQEGKDVLYLNAVGVARPSYCYMENATVTLLLPKGYKGGYCKYGTLNSEDDLPFTESVAGGRTKITMSTPLEYDEGITVRLNFEKGSLSTYFDFTPFWFVIAGGIILALLFIFRLTVFKKRDIVPVVNFEAPNGYDPLLVGKLVDNKVNREDITSLIYYWADKGYLKINMDDEDDPELIRIYRRLPEGSPDYEITMYNGLFAGGDTVKISSLEGKFFETAAKVTSMVNSRTRGLFRSTSLTASVLFALAGGLLLGLAPFILSLIGVGGGYFLATPFLAMIPALVVYGLAESLKFSELKLTKKKMALYCAGIALLCAVLTALYTLLVPSFIIGVYAKIALAAVSCLIVGFSVLLVCKSDSYIKDLGEIVGFKNFITLAEKDKLEKMLEDDPQYYYHILPYAQVLGVSDKWEEKFEGLTVEPPRWATYTRGDMASDILTFHIINRAIRANTLRMATRMITPPSSSGGSGRGGFGGGGHVGGGHGGGGFGGR